MLEFYCSFCEVYVIKFVLQSEEKTVKVIKIFPNLRCYRDLAVLRLHQNYYFHRNGIFNICILIKYIFLLEMSCNFYCVIYLKYTSKYHLQWYPPIKMTKPRNTLANYSLRTLIYSIKSNTPYTKTLLCSALC